MLLYYRALLRTAPGLDVVDDPSSLKYPMPLNASSKYNVEVGRIRQSIVFNEYGLDLFVSGDQLLRGAALNAVLIAEYMEKPYPSKFKKAAVLSSGVCKEKYYLAALAAVALAASALLVFSKK